MSKTNRDLFKTTTRLAGINGIAASLAAVITLLADAPGIRDKILLIPRSVLYVIVVTFTVSVLITFFVYLIRIRTADISKLKREVTNAFSLALKRSSFNPRRSEEKS